MRRGAKPAKAKVEAKLPVALQSPENEDSRIRHLEKRPPALERAKELRMPHTRRGLIARTLIRVAAILALAAGPALAQDVVKIGQIEAQTGANAIYGWMSSQGTALAVDEINKAGGFKVGNKTYKIQLIALDTRGEPKEATVQLKRLIEVDQAKYIFGPFLSNVFLAVRPYAAEF